MADNLIIRASSWADLFDCAHRWEARNVLGMTMPSTRAAHLGTSIHAATAAFDKAKTTTNPITASDAKDAFADAYRRPKENILPAGSDLSEQDAEAVGLALTERYAIDISPQRDYAAVELTTKPLKVECEDQGVSITLTGTLDRSRVSRRDQTIGIVDIKTGKRAVTVQGEAVKGAHHIQLGVYELLAEHTLGSPVNAPAEIIGMHTTKSPRIGTALIAHAKAGLVGTQEAPGLIEMAATMLKAGSFPPNPRSMLCHKRYCPRWTHCLYRGR